MKSKLVELGILKAQLETIDSLKAKMETLDADGDGVISREELEEWMKVQGAYEIFGVGARFPDKNVFRYSNYV